PGREHGRIEHAHQGAGRLERGAHPLEEPRLHDRVQPAHLVRIRKDDLPEPRAIDLALAVHHVLAECLADRHAHLGQAEDLPSKGVAVDEIGAALPEPARQGRLARGHRPCDADPDHPVNLWARAREGQAESPHGCASVQFAPLPSWTTSGTRSGMACSITWRIKGPISASSSGSVSKRSSSWTWRMSRVRHFRSASSASIRTIAILMRSAAEPWMGMLTAARSASARRAPPPA